MQGMASAESQTLHRASFGIRAKMIAVFLLAAVPMVGVVGWFGLETTTNLLRAQAGESMGQLAQVQARELEEAISRGVGDARYLARLREVRAFALECAQPPGPSAEARDGVLSTFDTLAEAIRLYCQVRYIDRDGRERARVNLDGEGTTIVADGGLQMKTGRYYVREALDVGPDEVYVSALDLNREDGEIERPLRPVMRFAAPVVQGGEVLGIVVLNLEAGPLLPRGFFPGGGSFLADEQGHYLSHTDIDKAWSGPQNLDTGHSTWNDFGPAAGQVMRPRPGEPVVEASGRLVATYPIVIRTPPSGRMLLVGLETPESVVLAGLRDFRAFFWRLLLISFALPVLAGVALGAYFLRPVRKLHTAVHTLAEGDFDAVADVRSGDEFEHLAADFNSMAERLREARDQERVALVGRMASTIIHDIKNPLTSISGFAHLLADREVAYEQREEMAQIVLSQADRILNMLQEILDFSREGEIRLDIQPVDLTSVLGEVESQLAPECKQRGIELAVERPETCPVQADRLKLERCVLNIARNAIEAMDHDGALRIQAQCDDTGASVAVSDTGPGLPPEIADKLFEPFVTHGKPSGTGLGLAITKSITEAHGGRIEARNNPDEGATFVLWLPTGSPEANSPH